eukprot:CAMPEP_0184995124 /NCGR_PEP_ID=MMETSP1098-20130426/51818_1 /TAXON_ID=89044 /ORGANISM="Spumella elongata, Strain CCAP 955/1" /LENGTH=202 /DNA_ID=CAMNT_0027521331 /DNA_START=163 /DNA_END=771 /DNA_ORIENTATION=+
MHAVAAFEQASAGSIFVLTTKGQDNQCGWYGCKGDSVKCNFNPHFLPDELNGIITFAEFAAMTKDIDQVLADTHMPMMPLFLGHFCIPFSPICVMMYYHSQRLQRMEQVLQTYTATLAERGYYWEQAPVNIYNLGIAFLKVNKTAADRYKQANPSKFEGTIAPSAVVACADPTEYALGQEGVEMATAQFIPSAQGEVMKREY